MNPKRFSDLRSGERGLSRRRLLGLMVGASAASLLPACARRLPEAAAVPAAILTPEQTVGPYYIEAERIRREISEGKPGLPLRLRVKLVDATRQTPLRCAAVDLWHCDARGLYSGYTAHSPEEVSSGPEGLQPPPPAPNSLGGPFPGPGRPPGEGMHPPSPPKPTDNATFLRGVQLTDADGVAEFATIYPGWYAGRNIHLHLRVHVGGMAEDGRYWGGHICHTGQIFFPEETSARVVKLPAYAGRTGHRTTNTEDFVFRDQGGAECLLSLTRFTETALEGEITFGVDPEVEPEAV